MRGNKVFSRVKKGVIISTQEWVENLSWAFRFCKTSPWIYLNTFMCDLEKWPFIWPRIWPRLENISSQMAALYSQKDQRIFSLAFKASLHSWRAISCVYNYKTLSLKSAISISILMYSRLYQAETISTMNQILTNKNTLPQPNPNGFPLKTDHFGLLKVPECIPNHIWVYTSLFVLHDALTAVEDHN